MTVHPFPPLYNADSRILILGSFPSVKSREQKFFYGHPKNRFWTVLSSVFGEPIPETVEDKKAFLYKSGVALWDVIASCDIEGSSDSSIKNVVPNDICGILNGSSVNRIFTNGKTAQKYYDRFTADKTKISAVCLPSTSPANAAWSVERLTEAWRYEIFSE